MNILAAILLLSGFFYIVLTAVGVLRLPDFYTRLHASGGSETLGMMLCVAGLAVYEGFTLTGVKLWFIVLFIVLANPIGTNVISRTAYRSGLKIWDKKEG
jgi:multicomponent Na+:H+ antiporter subunit G